MARKIFVKPTKGSLVRFPKTMKALPEAGTFVEFNSYWRRRLRDKSIVISKPEKKIVEKTNYNKREEK